MHSLMMPLDGTNCSAITCTLMACVLEWSITALGLLFFPHCLSAGNEERPVEQNGANWAVLLAPNNAQALFATGQSNYCMRGYWNIQAQCYCPHQHRVDLWRMSVLLTSCLMAAQTCLVVRWMCHFMAASTPEAPEPPILSTRTQFLLS